MTASREAVREAAAVYAAILDDPERASEIRAARERYLAARAVETAEGHVAGGARRAGDAA